MNTRLTTEELVLQKTGLVTNGIGPNSLGQVALKFNNGTETFLARSSNNDVIPTGSKVVVNEFFSPRTVFVSKI